MISEWVVGTKYREKSIVSVLSGVEDALFLGYGFPMQETSNDITDYEKKEK